MGEPMRIFVTGFFEGLEGILDALELNQEIELVGARPTVSEGAAALAGGHLDVAVHATTGPVFPADDLAAIREQTSVPVVILCAGDCAALLDTALEAGVSDVVPFPQPIETLVFSLRKVSRTNRRAAAAHGHRGEIVTVFSPKGGIGKTVVATNLASALVKHHSKRTLLVDLDLQFGDAAIMLGLEPERTIYDLVMAPGELDREKLRGYTTTHATGLEVLPAPMRPEDAELVTEGKLSRLLDVARRSYDVIVVDTSPFFHGPLLATLDCTDQLLLMCSVDVPTIKNLRLSLQTLELLSFPSQRIRVVLNRSNTKVGIDHDEIERALEMKISFELPSDRAVPLAVNRGNPVILADERADFSRGIKTLAKELAKDERELRAKRRVRWLRRPARAVA